MIFELLLLFIQDQVGLSPWQFALVSGMLLAGAVVQWTFNHGHGHHDHHDD